MADSKSVVVLELKPLPTENLSMELATAKPLFEPIPDLLLIGHPLGLAPPEFRLLEVALRRLAQGGLPQTLDVPI